MGARIHAGLAATSSAAGLTTDNSNPGELIVVLVKDHLDLSGGDMQ